MKTVTIILIFGLICKNKVNGENGLDLFELKSMFDKLDGDILKNKKGLENTVTCSGIEYLDCYKTLLKVYEENIKYEVANAINESILKKLTNYNALILLLFTKIDESAKRQYANESFTADLIDSIRFLNSNVYCVVDFLRRFDISPNDKLKHIIFHNDPKILNKINIRNASELRTLIFDYFKAYDENLKSDPIFVDDSLHSKGTVDQILGIFQNSFTLKQDIINFSTPFCSTQLPQMNENSWTWRKLQNSTLLSEKLQNSDSLMDWEDFKTNDHIDLSQNQQSSLQIEERSKSSSLLNDHFHFSMFDLWEITEKTFLDDETVRKIQDILRTQIIMSEEETTEDTNEVADPNNGHRSDSLNKMFKKQYDDAKFDRVDTFYDSVITTIDAYVTKVLFNRVLHLVSDVLTSYFKVISERSQNKVSIDKYFGQILNFGYELDMFLITLEMYINHQPLTLDGRTIEDMYVILVDVRARYFYHVFEIYDPKQSVKVIRRHLKDRRYHRDSNDHKFAEYTASEENYNKTLDDSLDELELININFVHITEVKIIPNEV